jgi:chromosome segregation protein
MYLKEIKISGFKSFADKINLSLDDNITCVVGPNGSGKSNIVDAVRWVLGEQSIKSLRGNNNMTDVIFSGSKSRNPLNLASVSLIFDNSDSYIKVPYSEISVTRKVYRSGENEYYINNEKCRLKDINDLFLDSGMGKYAFNIISQGEVGKILSDSSLDRRSIIEEAAGVLKYKKRKEEALRKLDKTNDNLTRVKDIISELDTQLEPLKVQSEEAKKFLEIKKSLEDIEIALIANDLEELNSSYNDTLLGIEKLQNEIVAKNTDLSKGDIDISKSKELLEEYNSELVSLNNKLFSLVKEEERLNGEKNIIRERSKYDSEDSKVYNNIANLKEEELIINNKLISLKTDIGILDNKLSSLDDEIKLVSSEIKDISIKRSKLESDVYSKNKRVNDIEYKIKYLNDYIEQGGSISSNAKRVLSNPKLKGVHNVISKLVSIDDKYALSLEVSLGGAKDYVVVDSPKVAKDCISYLKENNLGRVTFYPIDVIKPRYVDDDTKSVLNSMDGFIGVLADFVSYSSLYKNIIYNQLGNVLLVDTLDNANVISKKINNRYKIVTIDGEVINVGGSITGGRLNRKSVISEKYELQSLKLEKDRIIKDTFELNSSINDLLDKEKSKQVVIIEKEKNKIILKEEKDSKISSFSDYKKKYESISFELSNLEDLSNNSLHEEEERIINKYYDVLKDKEETLKLIDLSNSKIDSLKSEIFEKEASYKLFNQSIRALESNLKDLEIKNSKISVKMDNMLNILSDSYSITFEKAKANYILEIDPDVARKQVNSLKSSLKGIGNVNIGSIEEYERLSLRYEFLNKQTVDLEGAISTLLKIIDELDYVMKDEFMKTFKQVQIEFNNVFKELFGGGEARLVLTDKSNVLETGIDIVVTPPGKKLSTISLLSGGEKTLTAISLLFAILNIKSIPFCIFDEIEAALDEANVSRIGEYFKKYIGKTQLIIITHKKKTMEYANTLYGITMQESGVSKLVSVKLVD